ncbi:MAG TPA: ATP-binding cassette domain-containing protein [Chloroflexota bacterium]|nr:ATP-binding cassette domain-containing protein [Chloroflexota bacterium]
MRVRQLKKVFAVPEREAGLLAAARSVVRRKTREVVAVAGLSFEIEAGEMVGFLGPNGAGKTTTLKLLSGLLYPTGGEARVLGFEPQRRERAFLAQITLVMGNRRQLNWDLPAGDSFEVQRAIYGVPLPAYRATLQELSELLELGPLLRKPVRTLSLGERMRCEVAAALLHRPRVLFLDEPTLGLDVTMQRRMRAFIADYNRLQGATVLLTSHYLADVQALCKRVLIIHHGRLLYDGELAGLVRRLAPHKTIAVELAEGAGEATGPDIARRLSALGEVVAAEDGRYTLRVPKGETAAVIGRLVATLAVADVTVSDPPIEDVIEQVFAHDALPVPAAAAAEVEGAVVDAGAGEGHDG